MYALILAGGKGERLRPLTDTLPKPMVPVCGKPILLHQIEWLKAAGVTDVVFLAGYLWETIQDYFGDGKGFGIRAHYSVEDAPLGRGGAIRNGFPLVPEEEETVVQFHPKKSEYVNTHPYCLHLWRRQSEEYELPPKWMIG